MDGLRDGWMMDGWVHSWWMDGQMDGYQFTQVAKSGLRVSGYTRVESLPVEKCLFSAWKYYFPQIYLLFHCGFLPNLQIMKPNYVN